MLLCFVGFVLQSSLLSKIQIIVWSILSAIFLLFAHRYAINESYSTIKLILANQNIMYTFSIIITLEAILGILVNLSIIKNSRSDKFRLLKHLPSVTWFISIYFIEILVFLKFPGFNFVMLAAICGLVIAVTYLLLCFHFTKDNERNFVLEMKFFTHLIQVFIAGIISVVYSSHSYINKSIQIELKPLGILLLLALPIVGIGLFTYNRRILKLSKKY